MYNSELVLQTLLHLYVSIYLNLRVLNILLLTDITNVDGGIFVEINALIDKQIQLIVRIINARPVRRSAKS